MYHQTFIWPPDPVVAQRLEPGSEGSEEQRSADLQRYSCEVTGLNSAYRHVLKTFKRRSNHTLMSMKRVGL